MQGYEAILPDGVADLNDLSCDEYQKLTLRIYQDGVAHGMHVGMALGRFYEKHGITDTIPAEYADECYQIIETTMRECMESCNENSK